MRKKYRNGFWMESKFLQHSWRQLVCYKELSTHPQCFQYAHVFLKQPLLLNTSTFSRILSSGQLENLNTSLQSGQYFCTQENLNTKWFWQESSSSKRNSSTFFREAWPLIKEHWYEQIFKAILPIFTVFSSTSIKHSLLKKTQLNECSSGKEVLIHFQTPPGLCQKWMVSLQLHKLVTLNNFHPCNLCCEECSDR